MIFGSATINNVRRIKRYLLAQKEQEERKKENKMDKHAPYILGWMSFSLSYFRH